MLKRSAVLLAASIAFAAVGACKPDHAIKASMKAVELSPVIAAEALKGAASVAAAGPPALPNAPRPGAPPAGPAPQGMVPCPYQGNAADGRPVFLCNGYPVVQDPRTGGWVVYTMDQAAPPR